MGLFLAFFVFLVKLNGNFLPSFLNNELVILPIGGAIFFALLNSPVGTFFKCFSENNDRTLGSAKFNSEKNILALSQEKGLALGRVFKKTKQDNRFKVSGHILSCAPTRSGKGIGGIIPNLLEYEGSVVVLDIKGENYAVTARRRRELGHTVHLIDPFGLTGAPTVAFNWLDCIDLSNPDCISDSAVLADMLVVPDPNGDSYWDDSAKAILQGVILHVCTMPEESRNMGKVRHLLTLPEQDFDELLDEMSASTEGFDLIARSANTFLAKAEKDRSGCLSAAVRHTAFLDDPRIIEALSRSEFDISSLKTSPTSVYLVIPPDRLTAYKGFVRSFFSLAINSLTRTTVQPPHKVVFIFDEFAQLGKMSSIENGISLVAGYGVAFWIFIQDLSQLKGIYDKWQTFLANSTLQFFGCADYDTAKYISDTLGKKTVRFETQSRSSSGHFGEHRSKGTGEQLQARELMTPDEVLTLPPERPLVFVQGQAPMMLRRLNYLKNLEYQGKFDANPFYS